MGYHNHHAILVTSWDDGSIERSHQRARALFGAERVSELQQPQTNNYRTFVIFPDGSKEGWSLSKELDALREEFKAWLATGESDEPRPYCEWVEVAYDEWDSREIVAQQDLVSVCVDALEEAGKLELADALRHLIRAATVSG